MMEDFNEHIGRKKACICFFLRGRVQGKDGVFRSEGDEYLLEHYEVLHSMGARAILEEIEAFIRNRREQA